MGILYSRYSPDEIEDKIEELDSQISKLEFNILEIESDIDCLQTEKAQWEEELDMLNEMVEDLEDEN